MYTRDPSLIRLIAVSIAENGLLTYCWLWRVWGEGSNGEKRRGSVGRRGKGISGGEGLGVSGGKGERAVGVGGIPHAMVVINSPAGGGRRRVLGLCYYCLGNSTRPDVA